MNLYIVVKVILEKRLGVAQLCLLLAVLVFMGLTRGSRAGDIIDHSSSRLNRSVRQWGERHFKLSNSWADRFKAKNLSIDLQRANDKGSLASSSRSRSASPTTPQILARPKPVSVKTYPTAQLSSRYNGKRFVFAFAKFAYVRQLTLTQTTGRASSSRPAQKPHSAR